MADISTMASPQTMADDATVGTVVWNNPDNAKTSDDSRADSVLGFETVSHYLKATNFGFAIPTGATIKGIVVEVEKRSSGDPAYLIDNSAKIVKDGVISGDEKANPNTWPISTNESYVSYGSSADLWGETWTPADINDTTFGFVISATNPLVGNPLRRADIDHIRITVYYTRAFKRKQILIKASQSDGTFIRTLTEANLRSFTKNINGGLGECIIDFGVKFDYAQPELVLGNHIDILVGDTESIADTNESYRRIYSGYISLIEPFVEEREKVVIHCLGHYTKLNLDILKSGLTTTMNTNATTGVGTGAVAASDIGLVMRGIIDRYVAETTNPQLNYTPGSIPDISTNMQFSFEQQTYREAMDKVRAVAPADYYFYVDEDGEVTFRAKSTSADHNFTFGRDMSLVRVSRSMEKIRNVILIWDGQPAGIYRAYEDADSIVTYGRRIERLNDFGIQVEATADEIGTAFILENKDPDIKVIVEILDSNNENGLGFDIEDINPGNTCSFFNFNADQSDIFRENMLITKVTYTPEKAIVTVERFRSSVVDLLERSDRGLGKLFTNGTPAAYTT